MTKTSVPRQMDKAFDPKDVEPRWRSFWEEKDFFRADPQSSKPPFVMVIPPPNITGRLHVGHGLNNTLQDILARWKRMDGHDVLWLPGSDHASIATHVMIERALGKEGLTRGELGRERFLERAWAWKEKYGGEITEQLRRLGASCDWSRERFTMDPGLSRAVREVFVRLYEEGLIYRGRYMINWCPACGTAVSDLEVVHKDVQGKIWTVRYPLEGGGEIQVATTRPETILGDAAVAVHPDDKRYAALIGRQARLPVVDRLVPIVADAFVDPEFGTGAVKVTPAHDPNDFQAGLRLSLEPIVVMNERGSMTDEAGPYAGLDRFECRRKLLERLEVEGLVVKVDDHRHSVGHCQRSDTIVEPMISLQWFVRIEPLARPALEAVENGTIGFIPDQWRKTYYEWMRNIRDWCISRQLWWGHRIPAWYCGECPETIVSREDPATCTKCGGSKLEQDPDILDTWFSSALWPFSTLGWPDDTPEVRKYYPGSVLVTGYDIIFFWVARMVMMGMKFMDGIPFHQVFYNGLVRDAHGEKISKTKGNVIDLFDIMDEYGTDAVRFTYAALTGPGSDVPLAPGRLKGSREFANKIWNAVRFAHPHLEAVRAELPRRESLSVPDRWILSRSSRVSVQVRTALTNYRFDEAAETLYQFTWHEVCDWYLELIKPTLFDREHAGSAGARATLAVVLERLLRLLHPIMPFLTEELWQSLPVGESNRPESIALSSYPDREEKWEDDEAEAAIETLMDVVTARRNLEAEVGGGAARGSRTLLVASTPEARRYLEELKEEAKSLTRSGGIEVLEAFPDGLVAVRGVTSNAEVAMPLEGLDIESERGRLREQIGKIEKDLSVHERKLRNEKFVARAKPEAVQKVRDAHSELSDRIARMRTTLEQLGG